jgi:hypothetical protein
MLHQYFPFHGNTETYGDILITRSMWQYTFSRASKRYIIIPSLRIPSLKSTTVQPPPPLPLNPTSIYWPVNARTRRIITLSYPETLRYWNCRPLYLREKCYENEVTRHSLASLRDIHHPIINIFFFFFFFYYYYYYYYSLSSLQLGLRGGSLLLRLFGCNSTPPPLSLGEEEWGSC